MDRQRLTRIGHAGQDFWNPLPASAIDGALDAVDPLSGAALDIGCGSGPLAVRLAERGLAVTGVDPDTVAIENARIRCPSGEFIVGEFDAYAWPAESFQLLASIGCLPLPDLLNAARRLLAPDGLLMAGVGCWDSPPPPPYLAFLGGDPEHMPACDSLRPMLQAAGLETIAIRQTTLPEWDAYEHGYAARVRAFVDANPADPDASTYRGRIDRWAEAYEAHGRGVMGFALLTARRAGP
jgi:SAM-dependent methyltransferase